jgi:GTP-binding protein HflX
MSTFDSIPSRKWAILVHLVCPSIPLYDRAELVGMAKTAGYEILYHMQQQRPKISTKYFLGRGKMDQIKHSLEQVFLTRKNAGKARERPDPLLDYYLSTQTLESSAETPEEKLEITEADHPGDAGFSADQAAESQPGGDESEEGEEAEEELFDWNFPSAVTSPRNLTILFNNRIGHMQVLTLQREWGCTVIDRDHLILEIFEQHARTRESKLQIELARMTMETSLIKKELGQHLAEHQGAGFMGKGMPGYAPMQRALTARRKKIQQELEEIRQQRGMRRKARTKFFNVGIIGYTNAGKTTFLNALTKARLETANQEFTTVSTTSRKLVIPHFDDAGNYSQDTFIFTDSVGFVSDISNILLDAFLSTLEELQFSDHLLIVVDLSDPLPRVQEKLATSLKVIQKIGADRIPCFLVLNKADLIPDAELPIKIAQVHGLFGDYPQFVLSSMKKTGLDALITGLLEAKRRKGL